MLQPSATGFREATVWVGPREQHTIEEIVEDGPVLLLFYLFDWTST